MSYEQKHNLDNGEDNRDGENNNLSSNYGIEGNTRRKPIVQLRRRQVKNMLASLLLSIGTPMIVAGDEILRTQKGNNNAYCQDNAISWIDWRFAKKNAELFRFAQAVIDFRKKQPTVRRATFLTGRSTESGRLPDVSWYGPNGGAMNWSPENRSMTCVFGTAGLEDEAARPVMLMLHAGQRPSEFSIPPALKGLTWRRFIDTSVPAPDDVCPALDGPTFPASGKLMLNHHTLVCYVGPGVEQSSPKR